MDRLENLTLEGELAPNQVAAIIYTKRIADSLLGSNLERFIVQDYRDGETQLEIARRYIPEECEISEGVANNTIRMVIRNTKLLTDDEKEKLKIQHYSDAGQRLSKLGKGIHALSKKEMSEHGRSGGEKTFRLCKGIYGRTKEEMSEDSRKGGQKIYELGKGVHGRNKSKKAEDSWKITIAKGFIPFYNLPYRQDFVEGTEIFMPEIAYAYNLSLDREYQLNSKNNNKKIAEKLNKIYHDGAEIRNTKSIAVALSRFRKTLKKK